MRLWARHSTELLASAVARLDPLSPPVLTAREKLRELLQSAGTPFSQRKKGGGEHDEQEQDSLHG